MKPSKYEIFKVSDKPIINNTYKHKEARGMGTSDKEIVWSPYVCPSCGKEGKLRLYDTYCSVQWEGSVDLIWTTREREKSHHWLETGNEYTCSRCKSHIYYAQKYQVYYLSEYYALTSSVFNPYTYDWETKDVYIPEIPDWDQKTCPACNKEGLISLKGQSEGCCTGKSWSDAVQHCPHCGMYVQSHEYED